MSVQAGVAMYVVMHMDSHSWVAANEGSYRDAVMIPSSPIQHPLIPENRKSDKARVNAHRHLQHYTTPHCTTSPGSHTSN